MDLRPNEGPKMKLAQHTDTKEHKTTPLLGSNMNNSRSERRYSKSEPDFDYYVAKKFNSKSEKERELYFDKLLEAFRTLSEEAPEVFDSIAPEMLQRSIWSWRGAIHFSQRNSTTG